MDSTGAETHIRLLAESELRRAVTSPRYSWLDEDFKLGGEPPQEAGLLRVRAALSALCHVGVLGPEAAGRLAGEFTDALAARGLHQAGTLPIPAPAAAPDEPAPGASPGGGAPGGHYQAIPVGVVVPAEREGHQGEVHVQALVIGPGRAALVTSFASTWREAAVPAGDTGAAQPSFPPFGACGLTDDQGGSYRLTLEAGEGGWYESGVLALSAVPPAGIRWLDLPVNPGRSVRIDLAGAPAIPARAEARLPRLPGEMLLSAVADTLLGGGQLAGVGARLLATGLAEVADTLTAAGMLAPDSLAVTHLAALCQRRAIEVRGPWAARAGAAELPGPWASVLSGSRRQDGPRGAAPAAVALPEIDGARFILAGLASWERQATLLVFGWGWRPRAGEFRPQQPFSWWARDDAGRWHVGRATVHGAPAGTFRLEFSPPLHPDATSLDIILTGRSARVTATVPLAWARVAEPEDQDISY
jgi:hypothetical protein